MNEQLVYLFSCILSCAISIGLLIQFLDDRFKRAYTKKWIYWSVSILSILLLALLNLKRNAFLNAGGFLLCAGIISALLYSGGHLRYLERVTEAAICIILMGLFEGVGVYLCDIIMQYSRVLQADDVIKESIEVVFSKMVLLFLYYVLLRRFWKKGWKKDKGEYLLYLFMFFYNMLNLTVIIVGQNQMTNYIVLCVNWCSLLFANMYIFYYMQMSDEKKNLGFQLAMMEQQEHLQFEYYQLEKGKYDQSISILHDVSKHIRVIESLYHTGKTEEALTYTKEIDGILKPLLPIQYSDNPIFDILLMNQKHNAEKQGISFEFELKSIELGFMEPIDVTTLFGNLLENAIAACSKCTGERYILLKVENQYDMLAIRVEKTVEHEVHLIDGKPVHPGQYSTGIGTLNIIHCVEKYDGSILYKNNQGSFICDILLNI